MNFKWKWFGIGMVVGALIMFLIFHNVLSTLSGLIVGVFIFIYGYITEKRKKTQKLFRGIVMKND